MDASGWIVTALGTAILLLVLVDVFLSVLHIDSGGIVVPRVHRWVWRLARIACRAMPGHRRALLALAGPMMMVAMFSAWIGLFLLGFACLYWPHLQDGFWNEPAHGTLTFIDALYYSGNTGTVLGFGDITPVLGWLKVVSVVQATLGFALLTGIVTYLLNVVSGVTERNALCVRLRVETNGTGDGVAFVTHALPLEDVSDVVMRLANLRRSVHEVSEKMHQFPILDLFYRARDPARDPERMVETLSEIALSARLTAAANPYRRLRPTADGFVLAVNHLLVLMANLHLHPEALARFRALEPEAEDGDHLERITHKLEIALGITIAGGSQENTLLIMAARSRMLLEALDRITLWRQDQPSSV
jgi:hypothetical protein